MSPVMSPAASPPMQRFPFQIELLEETVISSRAATVGGHESLDYIPGQTLLGACAAQLYRSLGAKRFAVFHAGRVRFGNALPYCGEPLFPMPLSWHQDKLAPASSAGHLDPECVFNFQHLEPDGWRRLKEGAQAQQIRSGYVGLTGRLFSPARALRMKTAIDTESKRAAEGQLFGYQSIPRGSRFYGAVEFDPSIDKETRREITSALQGEILLGRSRSAEYGRARLSSMEMEDPVQQRAAPGDRLTLWLLSDLALCDPLGQPTLEPTLSNLGVESDRDDPAELIDWGGSYIRSRRYSPWNGYRRAPDLERWVIQQGSVITLRLPPGPTREALLAQCVDGLGLHREAGLGRVWVDPPLLAPGDGEHPYRPRFDAPPDARPEDADPVHDETTAPADRDAALAQAAAESPLIAWLAARQEGASRGGRAEERARRLAATFETKRQAAARFKGLPADADFGPSKSQWGRVLEAARIGRPDELLELLFEGDDAIVKESAEGWLERYFEGNQAHTLAYWLKGVLAPLPSKELPRILQRLAHRCRASLNDPAQQRRSA